MVQQDASLQSPEEKTSKTSPLSADAMEPSTRLDFRLVKRQIATTSVEKGRKGREYFHGEDIARLLPEGRPACPSLSVMRICAR
jgi:hypothetical protein